MRLASVLGVYPRRPGTRSPEFLPMQKYWMTGVRNDGILLVGRAGMGHHFAQ